MAGFNGGVSVGNPFNSELLSPLIGGLGKPIFRNIFTRKYLHLFLSIGLLFVLFIGARAVVPILQNVANTGDSTKAKPKGFSPETVALQENLLQALVEINTSVQNARELYETQFVPLIEVYRPLFTQNVLPALQDPNKIKNFLNYFTNAAATPTNSETPK